ncbi:hypothetical protein HY495_01605 [Candidatus Woesearchaeota archaeon]|nr:hypothetical protein [Candidatus Woesearchaeota archaeon]
MAKHTTRVILIGILFLFLLGLALASFPLASVQILRVTETDLVRLQIEGHDADDDQLTYTYSPPLNQQGEWQTTYGDAGEYNLRIAASDGKVETTEFVKLIVDQKNRPPRLRQEKITVSEGEMISLKNNVEDLEGDALTFIFSPPFNRDGEWLTDGRDQGTYRVEIQADDGQEKILLRLEVEVRDVNLPPRVMKTFSDEKTVISEEDQTIDFYVDARDDDGDLLQYQWQLANETLGAEQNFSHYFGYGTAGEYVLQASISDGVLNTTEEWRIIVKKKNRKPEFEHIPIVVNEGETVRLDLPSKDIDGDEVIYSFEAPLNAEGEWRTGFNDSGHYRLRIEASDGMLNTSGFVEITIKDVDQKPIIILPEEEVIFEGQQWNLTVAASDPDQDDIFFSAGDLPEDMTFSEGMLRWNPGYDTIQRKGGFVSDVLNTLRLEYFFLKERIFPITVTACGKKECTTAEMLLRLRNVNRPPVLKTPSNVTVQETETLSLTVAAVDPDRDIVHYSYTDPLSSRRPVWKTEKGDRGEYTTVVTATDGQEPVTAPIHISVTKKNALPEIIVDDTLRVKEGQEFTLRLAARDADEDHLTLKLRNPPPGASFKDGVFVWQPGFNSVVNKSDSWWNTMVSKVPYIGTRFSSETAATMLEFVVDDGETEVIHPVKIEIVDHNRRPQVVDFLPDRQVVAKVGEPVVFHVVSKDADGDELTSTWKFNLHEPRVVGTDTIERTFVTAGEKKVRVEISDGVDSTEQEWAVLIVEEGNIAKEVREEPFTVRFYELEFGN